jgi:hypothetical protein
VAFVVPVAVAGPTGPDYPPQVTLTIEASKPRPDPEDTVNLLGRRYWEVDLRVKVSSDRACDRLSYSYRTQDLFDGRSGGHRSYAGRGETFESMQTADFGAIQGTGSAGDTILFTATGSCSLGGANFLSPPARLRVTIPPRSCDAGPLRILRLTGHAWREDLNVLNKRVPLYAGHYVWEPYTAWLARGGRIAFGAPECAGFRISLRGGREFFPGSYERRRRGGETGIGRGALARFVGDRHAGGIATEDALVVSAGSRVATFEVYSYPERIGRLTRVRVVRGAARVWGAGPRIRSAPVLLRSGYVTTVRCTAYRQCRPDRPRRR